MADRELLNGVVLDLPAVYVAGEQIPDVGVDQHPGPASGALVRAGVSDESLLSLVDQAMMRMFRAWMDLDAATGRCTLGQVRAFLGDAQAHLAKLAEVVASRSVDKAPLMGEMSIDEVLAAFEGWIATDVARGRPSEHTTRNYVADARQYLEWLQERGVSAAAAGEDDILVYRAWLAGQFKAGTVGRKLISVRRLYALALRRALVGRNPVDGIQAPRDATQRHAKIKCLNEKEARRLLQAPDVNTVRGLRDLAMLTLMMIHGLRVVEVERLDLDSIDWGGGRAGALRVFGKRDKYRDAYLTVRTRNVLQRWLEQRTLMTQEDPALFLSMAPGKETTRMSRRAIRDVVDGHLEAIGAKRPGISCHALRHTFATEATDRGARMETLSLTMGHESVTTTQVYQDRARLLKENPAELVDELLDGIFG